MSSERTWRFMIVLAVLAILLPGCKGNSNTNNADKLIGDWAYKDPARELDITVTITKDTLTFRGAGLGENSVQYAYVDGDTLRVTGAGGEEAEIGYTLKGERLKFDFGLGGDEGDEQAKREYIKVK